MDVSKMIHRLKTYQNGVHGDFFLEVADLLTSLITEKEPSTQSPAAMAGSAMLVGFSKEEIKAMVDSVYGSVEWVWTEKGGKDVLVCYPNANGEVFIYDES